MPPEEAPVPDSVKEWFEARHPGAQLEFHVVDTGYAPSGGISPGRRISGWFTISAPSESVARKGRVRFFVASVSKVDGEVIEASEHRPTSAN